MEKEYIPQGSEEISFRSRLLAVTAHAARYCVTLENVAEMESDEFIREMLDILPQLYIDFNSIDPATVGKRSDHGCDCGEDGCHGEDCCHEDCGCGHAHHPRHDAEEEDDGYDPGMDVALSEDDEEERLAYYGSYVDEDYYDSVRRHIETLLGPDDVFLETFEEDMKYSDTPIAASISESLADIFQPLYNFISIVKESEGDLLEGAFRRCREEFEEYWSQTLCNVMRPLNNLRFAR